MHEASVANRENISAWGKPQKQANIEDMHKPTRAVSMCRTPEPCGEVGSRRRWCHKGVQHSVRWKIRQTIQCQLIFSAYSWAHLTSVHFAFTLATCRSSFLSTLGKVKCFQQMVVYSNHCLYRMCLITHCVRTIPQKRKSVWFFTHCCCLLFVLTSQKC